VWQNKGLAIDLNQWLQSYEIVQEVEKGVPVFNGFSVSDLSDASKHSILLFMSLVSKDARWGGE
jgi:hypothetical protein